MPASLPAPRSASPRPSPGPWSWRRGRPSLSRGSEPGARAVRCAASSRSLPATCGRSCHLRNSSFWLCRFARKLPGRMPVDHVENLGADFLNGPIRVQGNQPSLGLIVICYRPGLDLVGFQTGPDNLFTIIIALYQLGTVLITQLVEARRLKVEVVDPPTGGTGTPTANP